ncbi:MAG: BMP family ABC transporter substrate-binding protein [Devosia sp.]|nr:BMP family ABC transporter substrate-binding protein [Devosia sp.]
MTILPRRTILKGGIALAAMPALGGLAFGQEKLKVGFAYLAVPGDYGWTYAHDQGANDLIEALGDRVEVTKVENVGESGPNVERVLRELAQQGHKLIFATTFGHMEAAVKVSAEFPDVIFEHCTGFKTGPNLGTYNARFYEGRAVIGTIAGHMSTAGVGGYLASFPIPEVVMGIDAFCIAARKVNPGFTLRVIWLNTWFDPAKEADAARALIDQGCDVITQHTDSPAPIQVCEERGVISFGQASDMASFGPNYCLTSIVDNWGPHYISAAQKVLDGTWVSAQPWEGLKDGAVVITPYNDRVPADVAAAADAVRQGQIDGTFHIFTGPIKDKDGNTMVEAGVTPDDGFLLGLQTYSEGVQA